MIFLSGKLCAQSYYFRHYQVENGLSNNTVFTSIQDQTGFLWFGTKDGLNRFDGYRFKQFTIKDTGHILSPDVVVSLLADKKNTLWVGCQKGLYIFDRDKECLVSFIDSLPDINQLLIDHKGQLWFLTRFTICRYNFEKKLLTLFPTTKYFEASSLCLSPEGEIWASSPNGFIHQLNEANGTFKSYYMFSHSLPPASSWIQKIYPAGKGAFFVGTSAQGLKRFDLSTNDYTDVLTLNPDKTTVYVRDIKQYAENEFWIATESGIFILNTITQKFTNLKKKFLDPYSLSDNAVYSLCKDKEGGIWAGTYFGGINYYSKQYAFFQKYFPDNSTNSISGSAVREICGDKNGDVWIGTEDAGLNKLNPETGAITQFKPTGEKGSIAYSNIHGLATDDNDLWIGTFEHGLDVMNIATGKIRRNYKYGSGKKDLKSNFIVSLLRTKAGELYIGTSNSLYKYDRQANGFDYVPVVPHNVFVSALMEDHEHNVWIATHNTGLYYFNPITNQQGHFKNEGIGTKSLAINTINALYEDSRQNIWICTEGGGLSKLDKDRKTFSTFTTQNGLPSNFVFKILEDNNKKLWITTSRGLVNFDPQTQSMTVYTRANGLLNDQFNYNSGYKDEQGKLYFGSVKGMITFKSDELEKSLLIPPVYITGFQVQNKELEISKDSSPLKRSIIYTEEITLPYNRSSFSIDFAALSFISPEMTAYTYIMKGLDKEWTQIKPNRKIYFTNLSPGNYTFKLKSSTNGKWSPQERKLQITILPPIWATTRAYILYSIIAIALAYYLLRSYHIIVEDKKEREIYEAKLDFFTNVAHEIRTPLTLIKGPVENLREKIEEVPEIEEDVLMMERNTNRLIALITQILDFRQTETKGFSIDFVKVNITDLLNEVHLNFAALAKKRNLQYLLDKPSTDLYAFADEEALNKIFSNLLSNAVKYAQHEVHIKLIPPVANSTVFTTEVENDGALIPDDLKEKIFEPFYRLKDSLKQQGTGIGLALARSLTELHQGRLHLETNNGYNKFVLNLPLQPADKINNKKRLLNIKI